MSRLYPRLEQLFLPSAPATRLAVVRVLTGAFALWYIHVTNGWIAIFDDSPRSVFAPIGVTSHLSDPLSGTTLVLLSQATLLSGILFTLGLLWRISGPAFAGLLLYTMTYRNSWSMVFHHENMLVIHVLILSLAPAAGALALDPWLSRKWPVLRRLGFAPPGPAGERWIEGWVLKMMQIGATVPYVVAAVAKVRSKSGWAWALGDNLHDQVMMNAIYYELLRGMAPPITFEVNHWTWIWTVLAIGTLILEFGAPLALLGGRWALTVVLGLFSLHWGILWIMGIPFSYQLCGIAFACFVPWERAGQLMRRRAWWPGDG